AGEPAAGAGCHRQGLCPDHVRSVGRGRRPAGDDPHHLCRRFPGLEGPGAGFRQPPALGAFQRHFHRQRLGHLRRDHQCGSPAERRRPRRHRLLCDARHQAGGEAEVDGHAAGHRHRQVQPLGLRLYALRIRAAYACKNLLGFDGEPQCRAQPADRRRRHQARAEGQAQLRHDERYGHPLRRIRRRQLSSP
nr:nylB upstream ORF [Pseudomonas sp.]